ncbi:hypothetical protein [Marinobacter sp.]
MPVDEWGAIASNIQAELKANIKKDCPLQYDKGDLSLSETTISERKACSLVGVIPRNDAVSVSALSRRA